MGGVSFERMYDPRVVADGMIWWSTPDATCGLVVRDATVVDCPPYADKWARGADARQLWREGVQRGMRPAADVAEVKVRSRDSYLMWVPDVAEQVVDRHAPPVRSTTVRRWQSGTSGTWREAHVRLGWLPDGRWAVESTSRESGGRWLYAGDDQRQVRATAEAKVAELTAGDGWRPIPILEPGLFNAKPATVPEWPPGFEPG